MNELYFKSKSTKENEGKRLAFNLTDEFIGILIENALTI